MHRTHDVFISYSTLDKAIADAACAVLETSGMRCWIAPRDAQPGVPYAVAIIDAINGSTVFVLVLSRHSNASQQVRSEVERAMSKGLPIIPFRIEDFPLSIELEYFISRPHWLDAVTRPIEPHLARLVDAVRRILCGTPQDSEREGPDPGISRRSERSFEPRPPEAFDDPPLQCRAMELYQEYVSGQWKKQWSEDDDGQARDPTAVHRRAAGEAATEDRRS